MRKSYRKIMGTSEFKSIMAKLQNRLDREREANKPKKNDKGEKKDA